MLVISAKLKETGCLLSSQPAEELEVPPAYSLFLSVLANKLGHMASTKPSGTVRC